MKEKIDKRIVLGVVLILIILIGIYLVIKKSQKNTPENENGLNMATTTNIDLNASTTKVVDLGNGLVAVGKGDFKIEQIKDDVPSPSFPKPVPDLNRTIVFSSNLNEETKSLILSKTEELIDILEKNKASLSAWIDLGLYHKMAGDFNGAVIYWDYAGKLSPANFVSFSNLADLYGYYIKDTTKAELNFNLAISKAPDQSFLYFKFAEFYRDVLKDKTKALEVIERGLKVIPNNSELKALKDSLM